jgi:ferredoxin/flavodoxin
MENRRTFIKKSLMAAMVLSAPTTPGCITLSRIRAKVPMKTRKINKALVLWYSQTGYTERNGMLLAKVMEKQGIKVVASEMRDFDKTRVDNYDLLVIGSPVFYYDTPGYVKDWIMSIPHLKGTPVAAYVTYGGPEGNQYNAACSILECLVEKQGVPIGLNTFRNMPAYPLSWSEEKVNDNVWATKHLPNEETYQRVRSYAGHLIDQVEHGHTAEYTKKLTLRECMTYLGPVWWTKNMIKNHSIIEDKCIGCGRCVENCPVDAINLDHYTVDTESCVLCFGCINNCPVQAVNMEHDGKRLIGYREFMKRKNLEVIEPAELK